MHLRAGLDFQPLFTELNFSAVVNVSCTNITVFDDQVLESNETFIVQLSSSDPSVIVTVPQSVVTIIDDDCG